MVTFSYSFIHKIIRNHKLHFTEGSGLPTLKSNMLAVSLHYTKYREENL